MSISAPGTSTTDEWKCIVCGLYHLVTLSDPIPERCKLEECGEGTLIHVRFSNTEGVEKLQVLSGKIKMVMDVFQSENPEMIEVIVDIDIGDPILMFKTTNILDWKRNPGNRPKVISDHSILITFKEEAEMAPRKTQ